MAEQRQQNQITFESEYVDTLNKLMTQHRRFRNVRYFLDKAYEYFNFTDIVHWAPQLIVLGTSVPDTLIRALGVRCMWVLGGSLGTATWADDLVPRDADPVNRSILGSLVNEEYGFAKNAVILVPVTCDNARKIAYLLERAGYEVLTVDVPPEKSGTMALNCWMDQMDYMTEQLEIRFHRRVGRGELSHALKLTGSARKCMKEFVDTTEGREDLCSGALRMLVLNSYYYTKDLKEWTKRLAELTKEIKMEAARTFYQTERRPGVMLLGSPVFFPNYKIPFLIQDIGMEIRSSQDVITQKLGETIPGGKPMETRAALFRSVVKAQFFTDSSGAYVTNDSLYQAVKRRVKKGDIEGVVYHVLKGQIEYDFELERFEKLFARYEIPVFRLETDYQYQDVEQIRIRMEAFMEMLTQNRYVEKNTREMRMA